MKVMLDTCVWGRAVEVLRSAGHDVVWTGDWDRDPGDAEILSRAATAAAWYGAPPGLHAEAARVIDRLLR